MEAIQEQSTAGSVNPLRSKLRYPLRSANKSNEKPSVEIKSSSSSKRSMPVSTVSKSTSVLDLSGKDKSAKPPRRLSIPAKSTVSPLPKPAIGITPISEARPKKAMSNSQPKGETPVSDAAKSTNRRKFSVLSSVSYWLSQIKLSEAASKHSISLGFFKLALESGCEPMQRVRDELKLYARRHNLLDLGEPASELLRSYNVLEDLEQLQLSESISVVPEEGVNTSDDDINSSGTIENLKPKSLNTENIQSVSVSEAPKKERVQGKNTAAKNRASVNRSSVNQISVTNNGSQKNSQKSNRQGIAREKGKVRDSAKKDAGEKGSFAPLLNEEKHQDKENQEFSADGREQLLAAAQA